MPASALGFIHGTYNNKFAAVKKAGEGLLPAAVSSATWQQITGKMGAQEYLEVVNPSFERLRRSRRSNSAATLLKDALSQITNLGPADFPRLSAHAAPR